MISPVACRYCGATYDLAGVTVTARCADCLVFKTPCCDRVADDREWVSAPAFHRISDDDREFFFGPYKEDS